MQVTIYHNPRCSKSRQTLALLRERGIEPEIVEYLKHPPTREALSAILDMLGMQPEELMRKGEAEYRELVRGGELDREAQIALMCEHPRLIERPIVICNGRAALGRPPENVLTIL